VKLFLIFVLNTLLLFNTAECSDTEIYLGKFSTGDLSGWKEQTIGLMKPKTTYKLTKDNDKIVLTAHSIKSASGQLYKLNIDPKEYSTLKWSWKIDHIIKKGDERIKEGDDFSARVYVLFPRGFFSKTRAICYVWANKLPKGEHIVSPFTSNIITVAVDSGEELAGHWTSHQRNIYEDYKQFFGEEPPKIGAVALMTDTDNTGDSAVGYYGDISLQRPPKVTEGKLKDQKMKETPPKTLKTGTVTDEPKHIELKIKEPPHNNSPPTPAVVPQSLPQQ
jgi:hypothetical protein